MLELTYKNISDFGGLRLKMKSRGYPLP